jgi:hypothetical protein
MTFSTAVSAHVVRIAGWRRMFRAVMLSAMALCAQSGDWAQVQALVPGAQVDVKRFSGGLVRGTVESASADALIVRGPKDTVTVDRADARRVRLQSNEKTKNGRIAGAAILGTLGVPIAMVSDGGGGRVAGPPIMAGFGYLIGWAFDSPKRITIYRADKP